MPDTEYLDGKTIIIRNGVNVGVAEAYNQCIKLKSTSPDDIMLLDQDTVITKFSALKSYIDFYARHSAGKEIVGFQGRKLSKKQLSSEKAEAAWVINSGMLFTVKIWKKVGGFDQSFFVDDVDHEFCLRCRDQGMPTSISQTNAFEHEIGIPTVFRLFKPFHKISFTSTGHPPWRRYYWARNRTVLLARHRSLFSFLLFGLALRDVLVTLAFGDQRLPSLFATVRGFFHSFSAGKRQDYS